MAGSTLPERVAQIYYTYGLFCSSYPVLVISLALSVVLLCCFPLLNVPLPGNIPTVVNFALNDHLTSKSECHRSKCTQEHTSQLDLIFNETQKLPYIWAKDKPLLYAQQIIMKIGVYPWNSQLKMWDAFRAPLQEVFRLLETVRNHEDSETKSTLLQHCYQIGGIKKQDSKASVERVLPEYSCLLLSPANLWQQSPQTFSLDATIVNTIYNYQNMHKSKSSIAEIAFGMQLRDTGIKRYPLRVRPRVLQYAVTIFYDRPDDKFIKSLTQKLKEMYPLYQDSPYNEADEVTLIYYPGQFNYKELIPLTITFVGLFLYVYFSVKKIEFIKSKLGLAACAVLTIAGSLSMSIGICFFFGFSLSLQGKEIFPYLVIIVGLENVLVLTKSVTSTDSRLDVKIRLAQGLTKEGWSITKNLLIEITILTVSFFTFVPFIQEFSIFMIVSLISDFFVQMAFFATILGVEVRRMDYSQGQNKLQLKEYFHMNSALNWRYNKNREDNFSPQRMTKSKSHPRLNGLVHSSPTDVVAKRNSSPGQDNRVPKRIRLVNIWARTRFFQRAFMVWMIVWISMIIYNSGLVDYLITNTEYAEAEHKSDKSEMPPVFFYSSTDKNPLLFPPLMDFAPEKTTVDTNDTIMLKHSPHSRPWSRLSSGHWSAVLSHYNESIGGRYCVVLPPVLLSHRVGPERAAAVRNGAERDPPPLRWQALAAALDPTDTLPDFEVVDGKPPPQWGQGSELPMYPTTPMEILLLAILCTISVAVIAYMMVVLYRCVCSRHYAEWRASWNDDEEYKKSIAKQPAIQLVMEAVPLVVAGHSQEVECLVTDGEKIVSSCLQGNIKVWDSQNGEIITNIDRGAFFKLQKELYDKVNCKRNMKTSLNESNRIEVSPKKSENMHRLRKGLNSHLSGLRFRPSVRETPSHLSVAEATKYDFAKNYRDLYCIEPPDIYDCETKENVDISNINSDGDILYFNSKIDSKSHDMNINKSIRDRNRSNHDINRINHDIDRSNHEINRSSHLMNRSNHDINRSNHDISINTHDIDRNSHCTDRNNHDTSRNGHDVERSCHDMDRSCHDIDRSDENINSNARLLSSDLNGKAVEESPVWCMDFCNDLIILGCADGRLEMWEASSGKLVCVWRSSELRDRDWSGLTHVRALSGGRRVCVAALGGQLTLLRLDAVSAASGARVDWRFSTAHRRTHKRTGSAGSLRSTWDESREFCFDSELSDGDEVVCVRVAQCRPHQQPITELQCEGGRILTGAQDHVLKVFSSAELTPLFTLHGHCGPITSSFIDHASPTIAGSGSQDGLLCVWDLHTGACVYSMQAHDGAVTSLAYTASYVVSAGADERLCIWDRFQGHMLNSIHIGLNYMSKMLPLTHTLLVIGDRSGLTAYDLSSGDVIRRVLLGQNDGCILVRQILPLKDAIVCDYANQLRIVRFPLVSKLSDLKRE